ncbi:serine/threonine-protein kinase EDR1-like protein [Carex littledalei]|uniref:non-specific serine/threonine protein kinase n=1 Tax=Carex littledalei TaxID=544730 RepID=A0A833REA9_9POAL|nr:serine/threonine-protein kinase EDR1-like protein [Carex littledalei]
MEGVKGGDAGRSESGADLSDKIRPTPLTQQVAESDEPRTDLSSQDASQVLWSTGVLYAPIPNGFYSIIPEKKLKELFQTIPTADDLQSLGMEGLKGELILVDMEKDKRLSMLKQLSLALVKGLSSNPASLIKKLAGLVSDFYKRSNPQMSPAKATADEISQLIENRGIQLLGQIRHGTCRPRAILFKVLADAVGLECKLFLGLPTEEAVEYVDSYKHMSVVVSVNSTDFIVDLMRYPGQLIPFSSRAVFTTHISAAGESDSADYDSCDSPLEPNSPLCGSGLSDRIDSSCCSQEQEESSRHLHSQREGSDGASPSLRSIMLRPSHLSESKLSASHSEPNIANFWGRSQTRVVTEQHQRTGSSSPEHPLNRARGRSMLSRDKHSFQDYSDGVGTSRSDGASASNARRARRRSISITPEIGDDIVRAVRAMNESMRQSRTPRDQSEERKEGNASDSPNALELGDESNDNPNLILRRQLSSQKAVSLPSSPHQFSAGSSGISGPPEFLSNRQLIATWNKVLHSSSFMNKPLMPFEEWNIDFSELTVGTRVGIGFFGEVFRGIWNGTDVAIKVFLEQDLTMENMEDFCNEVSILCRLRHPNVILFLGACMKPPHLSLVTEYMEMGSLYYLIHMGSQKTKLSWRRRLKMLRDICRGLMCMHRMKIVHRDLKSANCLVNKHWTVKICDFGLSRSMTGAPMQDNSSAGTPEWMAPELIRNEPFTEKCDIFSLGVIMWELCTLKRPWDGQRPAQVVYSVANEGARLEIPEGPLGSLILDCFAEPEKRPNCQEILTRLLDCEYTLC